jgi:hypothetical protein
MSFRMIFEYLKLNIAIEDDVFNAIYPEPIRKLAKRHWTPVEVAKQASEFLAKNPGTKVLDLGSGAGKFCFVGAIHTKGRFTGIEQRVNLVRLSNKIKSAYHIENLEFIQANISGISLSDHEAFYFYNSFHENIDQTAKIDDQVETHPCLYASYSDSLRRKLSLKPVGTRLVTYWSSCNEVPASFHVVYSSFEGKLKFWKKIR